MASGVQRILINVVEAFRQKNIEVTVFLYQPKEDFFLDRLKSMGAEVIKLRRKRDGFSLLVVMELIRLYWRKFDCVFSFQPTANIYCILARVFSPASRLFVANLVLLTLGPVKRSDRGQCSKLFCLQRLFVTATQKSTYHHFPGLKIKLWLLGMDMIWQRLIVVTIVQQNLLISQLLTNCLS